MMRNDNNIYINTWITDEKKLHIKGRLTGLKVSRLEFEIDSYDAVMTFFIYLISTYARRVINHVLSSLPGNNPSPRGAHSRRKNRQR